MFPLSCVRVRAHTSHDMSAHKKTWSTYKFSFKNAFLHTFHTWRFKYIDECW